MSKVFEIIFIAGSEPKLYTTLQQLCNENGLTYSRVVHQIGRNKSEYRTDNVIVMRREVVKNTRHDPNAV